MSNAEYQLRLLILELRYRIALAQFDANMQQIDLLLSVVASYPAGQCR